MKHRLSVSIDESTVFLILDSLKTRKFRNKSHIVEEAVRNYCSKVGK